MSKFIKRTASSIAINGTEAIGMSIKKLKPPVQPLSVIMPSLTEKMAAINIHPALKFNDLNVYIFHKKSYADNFLGHIIDSCGPDYLRIIGVDTETTVHFNTKKVQPPSTVQLSFGDGLVAIFQAKESLLICRFSECVQHPKNLIETYFQKTWPKFWNMEQY